jgi:hypothetical protein
MTEGQPVRACAIQLIEDPEEAPLITLWETDARFQGALRDCEALEHTRSRVDGRPRCLVLVWQDFPTLAEVEAANVALHNEQWLWEVGLQFDNPREAPPIATLHQRLQYQRDVYSADVCA